jgi:hypothetical protein
MMTPRRHKMKKLVQYKKIKMTRKMEHFVEGMEKKAHLDDDENKFNVFKT